MTPLNVLCPVKEDGRDALSPRRIESRYAADGVVFQLDFDWRNPLDLYPWQIARTTGKLRPFFEGGIRGGQESFPKFN